MQRHGRPAHLNSSEEQALPRPRTPTFLRRGGTQSRYERTATRTLDDQFAWPVPHTQRRRSTQRHRDDHRSPGARCAPDRRGALEDNPRRTANSVRRDRGLQRRPGARPRMGCRARRGRRTDVLIARGTLVDAANEPDAQARPTVPLPRPQGARSSSGCPWGRRCAQSTPEHDAYAPVLFASRQTRRYMRGIWLGPLATPGRLERGAGALLGGSRRPCPTGKSFTCRPQQLGGRLGRASTTFPWL